MKFLRKTCAQLMVILPLLLLAACASNAPMNGPANDVVKNSVMITNMKQNSGGTGIIIRSGSSSSTVLTNSHVCHVVENGGLVTSEQGSYQVTGYKHSEKYDLCLIKVDKNLGYNTKISRRASREYYEGATVSGHPALYPTVVTKGHTSGRKSIAIMTGLKKCTAEDLQDPQKGLFCMFVGGLPIIKQYDSVLVTATIMPGSSGSGVYNSDGALAGVVFAGSGQLGYAWTVPYEAMSNFLFDEQKDLKYEKPSNVLDLFGEQQSARDVEEKVEELCISDKKDQVKDICGSFKSAMLWYK